MKIGLVEGLKMAKEDLHSLTQALWSRSLG